MKAQGPGPAVARSPSHLAQHFADVYGTPLTRTTPENPGQVSGMTWDRAVKHQMG
jgi:hypothetical protein